LKRILVNLAVLIFGSVVLSSCGSYSSPSSSTSQRQSGLPFRVFVSNPLQPTSSGNFPVFNIIDASKDVLSPAAVNLSGTGPDPSLMAESPDLQKTLVFSASNNSIAIVDNATEGVAAAGGTPLPAITLPDFTESMLVAAAGTKAYAAVRNAPIPGQTPGAVLQMDLTTGKITATLPVPNVHYIAQSHNGNRILALSDNSNSITAIATPLIGTNTDPRTTVTGPFDNPVLAIFSPDDSTAYVLNCGPECGGMAASITVLDLNTNTPIGSNVAVSAATIGLISGTTLYVAGTPPGQTCAGSSPATQATSCGVLSVVDLAAKTVTATAVITDGAHNRMEMGADGQLFIGARNCTNLNITAAPAEVRGCLSIFNAQTKAVTVPPENGDVTGIAPITNRHVVYVCQSGEVWIYDTTTDKMQTTQVDILGQASDVKLVDR